MAQPAPVKRALQSVLDPGVLKQEVLDFGTPLSF
jgi:hypothetical protein